MNNFNFNTFIEPYKMALLSSGKSRLDYLSNCIKQYKTFIEDNDD